MQKATGRGWTRINTDKNQDFKGFALFVFIRVHPWFKSLLVLRDLNADVPVRHASIVIALEEEGAGFAFVAVEGAAGDAGDGLLADHGLPIHDDRNQPTDERDVCACG